MTPFKPPIYLDYCATTPVDPFVLESMMPYLTQDFGNPSNQTHYYGQRAAIALAKSRHQLAALLDCSPNEIIFTSGATESNNLVFKGVAQSATSKREIITLSTEHPAVFKSAKSLEKQGFTVHFIPVNRDGTIDLDIFKDTLSDKTALVSIMYVNNETGVIQPIETLASLCKEHRVLFHCDAVQAVGKIPFSLQEIPIDFLSASAHKMYGPKGVGCLFVRQNTCFDTLISCIDGGGQEFGFRSGTQNMPGIVGFGAAAEVAIQKLAPDHQKLQRYFEHFLDSVLPAVPGLSLTGSRTQRYPGNIHLNLKGILKHQIMPHLSKLAISTGSACNSGQSGVSHVLKAMGYKEDETMTSLRLSMGRFTTDEDMDFAESYLVKQLNGVLSGELKPLPYLAYL